MPKIYLDHAATTPIDKQVFKAMLPYFSDTFGNPSSLHSFGQVAMKAVDEAREKIANFLGCEPEEIIFTSGATEADNLAIRGSLSAFAHTIKKDLRPNWTTADKLHVITTSIEHPAVLEVCKELEMRGVEVSYVKPKSDGVVEAADIEKEIKENTVLISVMYVNNEIGTIQPIREIGKLVKKINIERQGDPSSSSLRARSRPQDRVVFHTDAVQAVNYCPMKVQELGVDLLTISGHKIYGPKGVGVLYVHKGTPLNPIQFGGHHEQGLRPGTLNTPLIVGLGKAIELVPSRDNDKIKSQRDYLWQALEKNISDIKLNGSLEQRVPNNLNISIARVEGESLMLGLDLAGIATSTGSACSSGSLEPSHVLMALGLSHEEAHGSLRITLGKDNTREEVDKLVVELEKIVARLRKMAPN